MAISDWMRFQLAYGFGTVRAAKALEKWHSPTLLFHTEDWRLRRHGMGEEELRRVRGPRTPTWERFWDFVRGTG